MASARTAPAKAHSLDVGTGSGVTVIALKRVNGLKVSLPTDVDAKVLDGNARRNAIECGAAIDIIQVDVLEKGLPTADIIISNPPYIPAMEGNDGTACNALRN